MKSAYCKTQTNRARMLIFSLLMSVMSTMTSHSSIATQIYYDQTHDRDEHKSPKIQLAILLDTSNSMDGLIDQTRNQLWQVINEFSTAKKNGVTPILEVALFEYGNDNNSSHTGFVRKLNGFTQELDKVSEGLFSLTTNGGSEFCGFAINTAVANLRWSPDDNNIKAIFIAGNEPFTQGPVNYKAAINLAKKKGISVNTIHAGAYDTGIQGGWQQGALIAGGDYMSINADRKIVHIEAPQDKKITELNAQLNQTYIPYGIEGKEKAIRQQEQDKRNSEISSGLLVKRAKTKSSSFYNNDAWDLVDAMDKGKITKEQLVNMKKEALPKSMQNLAEEERQAYVIEKNKERKRIKAKIVDLSEKRERYVTEKKSKQITAAPSISDALTQSIKNQGGKKEYSFER